MKKIFYFALAAVALLSSCSKDFLTKEPALAQSDVLTLSTFEGIDKAVAGAYAPLASTSWYCGSFILSNEMRTMNGKRWIQYTRYNSGRYINDYSVNFTPTNTSAIWSYGYYVILSANSAIMALDNVEAPEQDKNNVKAEALFLRALAHFDLVRTFAQPYNYTSDASHLGVPVILTVDSEAKPARETVKVVFQQIIDDLLEAESIISPTYSRKGVTDATAAANINSIRALLSRVYLYCEQWQKAADYATLVINSGKYTMWTASQIASVKDGEFSSVFNQDVPKGGEVIFEVYENLTQSYGGGNENVCGMSSFNGYGDCGASRDLLELYEESDARSLLVMPDNDGNALFTMKYFGKGLSSIDANNTIVLRLSEMYLNRAEAIINGASIPGVTAQGDLEIIAKSRIASIQPATKNGVYTERAKELAWEGHLWFDLARTGRAMTRKDVSGTMVPTDIQPKDYRWAMPIPDREFTVNPNLVQNDGYNK
ncbi:MAG: RagB/SusD family nutrient uptake outer membrane protein [Candidatus Cryptobacteroides sp.]